MYDVIIVGSGPGGLTCGVNLAKNGFKVLILERNHYYGGTSYIFKRYGYSFPMGPLSFSSPDEVKELLQKIGLKDQITFQRNHFQLIAPQLDIIYSQPFDSLKAELKVIFNEEISGIEAFFQELESVTRAIAHIHEWHPAYRISNKPESDQLLLLHSAAHNALERYSQLSAKEVLERTISNPILQRFLGTQGTAIPKMSMALLGIMWYLMCEKGVWYPSCGIHGLTDLLHASFLRNGGEIQISMPVNEILIENNKAIGVKTKDGKIFKANWIVSNADYKSTFLRMISSQKIPSDFLQIIQNAPYFGSEFSVYLGVNAQKLNLSKVRAQHLYYRKEIKDVSQPNLEDFDNREIEICFWSDNDPNFAPKKRKKTIVLRIPFPYSHFAHWKQGEKKRLDGYIEYKKRLAEKLITTVENVLPGLASSIEVIEIATPLTYEEFGQRFHGSIAGWSWDITEQSKFTNKLLIKTPIPNLLMVGLYASAELFLGGVPTSMHTGYWASELIQNERK